MWRGGADLVANFVESERIMQSNGNTASFVQVRGSISILWEQIVDLTYKPKFEVLRPDTAPRLSELHFLDLRKRYGLVLAVDLVKKHGSEGRLSEKYASAMQNIFSDDIKYMHFDFHQICVHIHFDRLSILFDQIADYLKKQGYGKQTVPGILGDGWNALSRYYLNNFCDGTMQSLPLASALVLAGVPFAAMWLKQGMSLSIAAFVRANGRKFCNRPRLHKPRG